MLAAISCLYLLFSRVNVVMPENQPPRELRFWAGMFMAVDVMSHLWWIVLGNLFFTAYSYERNALGALLDGVTIYPMVMCVLLRMLQDKRRPLWPVWVSMLPVLAIVFIGGFILRSPGYTKLLVNYLLLFDVIFALYIFLSLRRYGRWLRDNYADLERKELWQSLLLMAILLGLLGIYKSDFSYTTEYVVQVGSLILIIFLVWRVETLQQLTDETDDAAEVVEQVVPAEVYNCENSGNEDDTEMNTSGEERHSSKNLDYIGDLLATNCEATQLYLQYDLTLAKLSTAIGTNRTYLGAYFAQLGITYNTYINRLRVGNFINLYRESVAASHPFTIQTAAQESGFQNYRTFSLTFKKLMGLTASEWIKQEQGME